jgi:hypothetical protein
MKVNIHVTTCHRSDVRCRPRSPEQTNYPWNVTEWTPEERLEISKISVASIEKQVSLLRELGHKVSLTVIDDGSDYQPAINWLTTLPSDLCSVMRNLPAGSSVGINKLFIEIPKDTDLVLHIEDDNLFFNPQSLDWAQLAYERFQEQESVITFRSGLPTDPKDKGYHGAWGPKGVTNRGEPIFHMMGNAHHLMLYSTYSKFMPLSGNTGGCEANMCARMQQLRIPNIELQEFIYMFHTHKLTGMVESCNINLWNKTGEGYEFGMRDMHTALSNRNYLELHKYLRFPNELETIRVTDYAY